MGSRKLLSAALAALLGLAACGGGDGPGAGATESGISGGALPDGSFIADNPDGIYLSTDGMNWRRIVPAA